MPDDAPARADHPDSHDPVPASRASGRPISERPAADGGIRRGGGGSTWTELDQERATSRTLVYNFISTAKPHTAVPGEGH